MKSLQDALYNWLTIKVVVDARPDDTAAVDTYNLFDDILVNEFHVSDLTVNKDDEMYYLSYTVDGEEKSRRYPAELIEVIRDQIQDSPDKYKNYPAD